MSIDRHDAKKMYCRMLGHHVTFAYCRQPGAKQPCRKIFDCWCNTFNIVQFMQDHFTDEEIKAILAPPKDKVMSLLELIEQAKKHGGEKKGKG